MSSPIFVYSGKLLCYRAGDCRGTNCVRVFISYSSAYHDTGESIAIRLREAGHEVFFDRHSLKAADEFDTGIRREVDQADLFIFLITPESVEKGAYTRTELKFAQQRWPKPSGRILPVMLVPTPISDLPPYVRAVTILQADGNLVAEVAARVAEMAGMRPGRRVGILLIVLFLALLLGTGGVVLLKERFSESSDPGLAETCYLRVSLTLAGFQISDVVLRVTGKGISQDFSTSQGGTANIHVTGDQLPYWEVSVIDRDGRTLGVVPLRGCPGATVDRSLDDGFHLELSPRDVGA